MSYQALSLTGAGYASRAGAICQGFNMGLSDFMLEVRIKLAILGTHTYIARKKGAIDAGWLFRKNDADKLNVYIYDGTTAANATSTEILNFGRWYYVVLGIDKSSATGLKLFIRGTEVAYDIQQDISAIGSLDNAFLFSMGASSGPFASYTGFIDEARVWNFGYGGLPADYATYITWRGAGRNVFLATSEYDSNSWALYADAVQTDRHDGSGTVANLVVGERYSYVTATPHTLDYQGGTLADNGVFTATHTTGTIASGDADDHVRRAGLVAHYKFDGDYLDETSNSNDLTAGGTGNAFIGYSLRSKAQKMLLGVG